MTNTQKLIELVIEDLKKPKWYLPEEVEVFLEERFQEVAQSARNERDAELLEMLPAERFKGVGISPGHKAHTQGFNECLSQVKALLSNPKEE